MRQIGVGPFIRGQGFEILNEGVVTSDQQRMGDGIF